MTCSNWRFPFKHVAQTSCIATLGLIKIKLHRMLSSTGRPNKTNNSSSYCNLMQLSDFMDFDPLSEVTNYGIGIRKSTNCACWFFLKNPWNMSTIWRSCRAPRHVCAQQLLWPRSGRNPMQGNPTDTNINGMTGHSLLHFNSVQPFASGEKTSCRSDWP